MLVVWSRYTSFSALFTVSTGVATTKRTLAEAFPHTAVTVHSPGDSARSVPFWSTKATDGWLTDHVIVCSMPSGSMAVTSAALSPMFISAGTPEIVSAVAPGRTWIS